MGRLGESCSGCSRIVLAATACKRKQSGGGSGLTNLSRLHSLSHPFNRVLFTLIISWHLGNWRWASPPRIAASFCQHTSSCICVSGTPAHPTQAFPHRTSSDLSQTRCSSDKRAALNRQKAALKTASRPETTRRKHVHTAAFLRLVTCGLARAPDPLLLKQDRHTRADTIRSHRGNTTKHQHSTHSLSSSQTRPFGHRRHSLGIASPGRHSRKGHRSSGAETALKLS